jgi:hypothetical protein
MNQFKYGLSVVMLGLVLVPAAGYANSWSCKHGNILREVKIEYSGESPVPCKVVYNKPDEDKSSKVLWNAESEQGFCEAKAKAFVAKLESWGWACTSDAAAEPAATTPAEPAGAAETVPEKTTQPVQPEAEPAMPEK